MPTLQGKELKVHVGSYVSKMNVQSIHLQLAMSVHDCISYCVQNHIALSSCVHTVNFACAIPFVVN